MRKVYMLVIALLILVGWGVHFLTGGLMRGDLLSGKKNIVVMGCDIRKGDVGRSDTLFVVMMDPKNKDASLLSIPRDTRVKIEGHGWDKINHAYAEGGHKLTRDTVENLLGIRVDNYVVIDFGGFESLVDVIGGVDINVEKRMYYYDPYADFRIDLQPGVQHMDGKTAIQYVRYRDSEGDIGRIRRQQKFMLAVYRKIASTDILTRIPGLAKQITSMIQTDLSMKEMIELGKALHGMAEGGGLKMAMVPGTPEYIDGISYWIPNIPKLRQLMVQMQDVAMTEKFRQQTEALEKEYSQALEKEEDKSAEDEKVKAEKEKATKLEAEKAAARKAELEKKKKLRAVEEAEATMKVRLVNCTGKERYGDRARRQLEKAGFQVVMQGDSVVRNETVVIATSNAPAVREALEQIPFGYVGRLDDVPRARFDAAIFLGKDFR